MSLAAHPRVADWIGRSGDRLVIRTGKVDIGQRISTALAQIAEDELSVPQAQIEVRAARTDDGPDEGITSGSNSIEQSGHAVRAAAATLRRALVQLALRRWGGWPQDWALENGSLVGPRANRPLPILDLLADIDPDLAVDPEAVVLAPRDAPPRAPMRGLAEMVRGRFVYIQDLEVPGMWHARVVRPPHARARLARLPGDEAGRLEAENMALLRDGSFLAVAGPDEWAVIRAAGRLRLACDWDEGDGLPTGDPFEQLRAENAQRLPVVAGSPRNTPVPLPLSTPDHAARYERPYTMHGALAPSAALALWSGGRLTIDTHSQGIHPLRLSIADSLGLERSAVTLRHVPGSGCYGHNGADDAAFEAALVARALPDRPILLKWSREDEHAWEPYGPPMAVELAATMAQGRIVGLSAEAISDTHRGRPRPGRERAGPAKLLANHFRAAPIGPQPAAPNMNAHGGMHRNLTPVYDISETRLVKNLVGNIAHRTSALRCLGAAANVFALESFVDEVARAEEVDPLAFRRGMLSDPRGVAVLDALARGLAARPLAAAGRGIGYAQYKGAMARVAVAIDLDVDDAARVQLRHALIVADAGRVVDLDGLGAQLEGGLIQGASWALHERVEWDRGGILSRDWDSYPVIRFDNIPAVDVQIIDRPEEVSVGAGEASPGPTLAAIANAIFDATGLRLRRLPFRPDEIMRVAAL